MMGMCVMIECEASCWVNTSHGQKITSGAEPDMTNTIKALLVLPGIVGDCIGDGELLPLM